MKNVINRSGLKWQRAGGGDFVILNDTDETHYQGCHLKTGIREERITQIAVKFECSGNRTGILVCGTERTILKTQTAQRLNLQG